MFNIREYYKLNHMITEKKENLLREVDVIKDREYILSELEKSESEKSYSFEESYKLNIKRLSDLSKYLQVLKIMKTL